MAGNLPAIRRGQSLGLPDDELRRMLEQAKMYIGHGVLPETIKTPQQALTIAMQGRELGLPMMASLTNIYPIRGNPMLSAKVTQALLQRRGYRIIPIEVSAARAKGRLVNPHGDEFVYEVTWEEAQAGGWNKNPDGSEKFAWRNRKVMLWNRFVTQSAKMFAAEALLYPPTDEDESMMVYDPEDDEFVSREEMALREAGRARDHAPTADNRSSGLFKRTDNEPQPEPEDGEFREGPPAEPEPEPVPAAQNGKHWTRNPKERAALTAFLAAHSLSEDEAKSIAGEWLHLPKPLALFSEWPHSRERLQRVLLGWLMSNRPADPESHWMKDDDERNRFWGIMGREGYDTEAVHARVPRTGAFPGSLEELVDFVLHSKPEDRWQPALPGMEAEQ